MLKRIRRALRNSVITGAMLATSSDAVQEKYHETFEEMVARAKEELATNGVTSEQYASYITGISDKVYESTLPIGYRVDISNIWGNIAEGREKWSHDREDAWLLYLGMSQKYGTFGISDYKPQKSKDHSYYYKINGKFHELTHGQDPEKIKSLVEDIQRKGYSKNYIPQGDAGVMGTYTLSIGQDEKGHYISYYDKWDLDVPIERNGFIGSPYEIYDRLYYNPNTFEAIGPLDGPPSEFTHYPDGRPILETM